MEHPVLYCILPHNKQNIKVHRQGRQEDWGGGGLGQIQKVGPHKIDCVRGVWGHAPRKF